MGQSFNEEAGEGHSKSAEINMMCVVVDGYSLYSC